MLFARLFRRTDAPAGRVADWTTVVQLVGYFGGSAVLSWLASTVDPIMQYGWGAVILAGLAAALVVSLVISAGLVAWRLFRPLPQIELPVSQAALTNAEEIREKHAELERKFDKMVMVVFDKLHHMHHDRETDLSSTSTINNRIANIEQALSPTPPGLMGALFQREGLAPDSRLAEIEAAAESLKDKIEQTKSENIELHTALRDHLKSQIQQIDLRLELFSTALKAKEARAMIAESDEAVLKFGPRLLSIGSGANDLSWEAEYTYWHEAVQTIDRIASAWSEHHQPFLNINRRQYEEANTPTPRNIVVNSDANSIRYKTVQIVQPSYANRRTGIIQYFDSKSREFF